MPQVSKRYLHKDIEEYLCNLFWEHLAGLRDRISVREFLENVLSDTERIMVSKRLAIAILLARGYTYEDIDDKLKVSKSTITGIHRQLLTGASGYKKAVEVIEKRIKLEKTGDFLEKILLNISLPAAPGSSRHYLKSEIGKGISKRKRQKSVF